MDKNPYRISADSLGQIREDFSSHNPNIILASDPFHKAELATSLLRSADCPVIFLDFDLMYSGYVAARLVERRENVRIIRTSRGGWQETLHGVLGKISVARSMVIIDSFNGFHSMYGEKESARFVNASLMLISYMGSFRKCPVVALALARRNAQNRWILSPGGRHITGSENSRLYSLRKTGGALYLQQIAQ